VIFCTLAPIISKDGHRKCVGRCILAICKIFRSSKGGVSWPKWPHGKYVITSMAGDSAEISLKELGEGSDVEVPKFCTGIEI